MHSSSILYISHNFTHITPTYTQCHTYEVPSEVNHVVIKVTSNSSVLIQWAHPTHPNGILTYYDVIVFNDLTKFNFSVQVDVKDTREVTVTEMGMSWKTITKLNNLYVVISIQSRLLPTLCKYSHQMR